MGNVGTYRRWSAGNGCVRRNCLKMADLFDLSVLTNPPELSSNTAPVTQTPTTAKSKKGARKLYTSPATQ